jgi:hypothetical protein
MRSRRDARRLWPGATLLGCAALLAAFSQSCAHGPPPRQVEDLCALFAERADWREATYRAGLRWQVSPGVLLAVIHQESRFRSGARPWWRFLGLFPVAPASSAYGYGQATDGTWRDYLHAAGRSGAQRDRFADAVDFVGWYADVIHRATRIAKHDAYHLYLAYHEGPGGFARGSHLEKAWLRDVARKVALRASVWDEDAGRCPAGEPAPRRAQGAASGAAASGAGASGAAASGAAASGAAVSAGGASSPRTSPTRASSSMVTPGAPSAKPSASATRSGGAP